MIDLSALRENPEAIAELLEKKEPGFDLSSLVEADKQFRSLQVELDNLRQEKKVLAKQFPVTDEIREQSIALGKKIKSQEAALEQAEKKRDDIWLACPNIPEHDVPVGNKESNKEVRRWGELKKINFEIKNHLELNEINNWFDLSIGAKMSGAQFVFYKEMGTRVVYALTQLMLEHNASFGFTPTLPPYLVTEKALYNSGNLPKFKGDFYEMPDDNLCLIPTAEVSLTNIHADEILPEKELPKRYTAWTSCYRREAGGYGSTERGLIRIHQFEKVELYSLVEPENSQEELDCMVSCAENFLQKLGLHYRVSLLAGQDCSFCSAKTYDIEVWLPGQDKYYEVSSASNCTDFQARRAGIRYRKDGEKKPRLVHTLNASSLAIPRLMVALMEQGQQEDGSIILPDILAKKIDSLW